MQEGVESRASQVLILELFWKAPTCKLPPCRKPRLWPGLPLYDANVASGEQARVPAGPDCGAGAEEVSDRNRGDCCGTAAIRGTISYYPCQEPLSSVTTRPLPLFRSIG